MKNGLEIGEVYNEWVDQIDTKFLLKEYPFKEKEKFLYWFDFGDDWKFNITVQKIIDVDTPLLK